MARLQEHRFIDVSKPVEGKSQPDAETRRSFLAKVSGMAALTAMAPEAFARNFIDKYDVDGRKLKNGRVFASMEMDGKIGFADGIRCDEDGNVWAGWATATTACTASRRTGPASA